MSSPDPDNISKFLSSSVRPTHPLDKFVNRVVSKLVDYYVVPWLVSCLQRYNESDFHRRMQDPNFDFLVDWKMNHSKFNRFISGARKFKNRYTFETEDALQKVLVILGSNGWTIQPFEIQRLRETIQGVRDEIYLE